MQVQQTVHPSSLSIQSATRVATKMCSSVSSFFKCNVVALAFDLSWKQTPRFPTNDFSIY